MKNTLKTILSISFILAIGCSGPKNDGSNLASDFVGIWQYTARADVNGVISARWIIIFDDGEAYTRGMPSDGYRNFDRTASKSNEYDKPYWATYTIADNVCTIKYQGGMTRKLTFINKNRLKTESALDMSDARRVPNVDGILLDGYWSYQTMHKTTSDIFKTYVEDERPLIKFSKDGTFVDHGQFEFGTFTLNKHLKGKATAGEGKYQIRDYTLILDYNRREHNHFEITFVVPGNENGKRPSDKEPLFNLNGTEMILVTDI